jgi:uncharacterized protein
MASQFELVNAAAGKFHFTLRAANGEKVLSSETYNSKASALTGIESVKVNAPNDSRYLRKVSAAKEPYFVLIAANGEPIGTSEMYSSESARDNGIAAVKTAAPTATLDDRT